MFGQLGLGHTENVYKPNCVKSKDYLFIKLYILMSNDQHNLKCLYRLETR
jgi:hypothetical protein